MIVRPARRDEIETVLALYDDYARAPDPRPSAAEAERIFDAIMAQGELIVAERNGQLVGSCMLTFCPNLTRGGRPFAVVENVIVAVGARRSGVGRALMKHAQARAQQAGCYKVMLATGREENRAFYAACGLSEDKFAFQKRFEA